MTLRKGLRRLDGVADAKLVIRPPHMEVRMKGGRWPDLPSMYRVIREAGYTPIPEETDLVVTGRIRLAGNTLVIDLDGMDRDTGLRLGGAKDEAETLTHLRRHAGEQVELEGRYQPAPPQTATLGTLLVTAIRGAGDWKPETTEQRPVGATRITTD